METQWLSLFVLPRVVVDSAEQREQLQRLECALVDSFFREQLRLYWVGRSAYRSLIVVVACSTRSHGASASSNASGDSIVAPKKTPFWSNCPLFGGKTVRRSLRLTLFIFCATTCHRLALLALATLREP